MSFDVRGNVTKLEDTLISPEQQTDVGFWCDPFFDATANAADWTVVVRRTADDDAAVVKTWTVSVESPQPTPTDEDVKDGVTSEWTSILVAFDATGLFGPYVWTLRDGDGEDIIGPYTMLVGPE